MNPNTPNVDFQFSDSFFDLYDRMIGQNDLPAVLCEVAGVVCDYFQAERASVFLINKETSELESAAVIGNVQRKIQVPIRESSLSGYCALSGEPFVVPDAYGDLSAVNANLRFDDSWDKINNFKTRDVMCAPALFKGDVLGVVQVLNSKNKPFSNANLPALNNVSRLIGYALYHARLYYDIATLKQLEKEKAGFMRIMVHELKSPVAAARMLADVLEQCDSENPQMKSMAGRIGIRLDEMTGLIQDILELARVKSGDPLGEISVFDIVQAVSDSGESYREQADAKGLNYSVELPTEPLSIRMDSKGFNLITSNLFSNAVKYTAEGDVAIDLKKGNNQAVLSVKDSGIGIPAAELPRLFKEFFRASNAKRAKLPGTGVGLAGVKSIVERFGGCMEIQTIENQGSTFIVKLPLSNPYSEVE